MKEKISIFVRRLKEILPTWLFDILFLILALLLGVFYLLTATSCSLLNRSSANGSRTIEKVVRQEQYWNVPAEGQPNQVNQISSTLRTY